MIQFTGICLLIIFNGLFEQNERMRVENKTVYSKSTVFLLFSFLVHPCAPGVWVRCCGGQCWYTAVHHVGQYPPLERQEILVSIGNNLFWYCLISAPCTVIVCRRCFCLISGLMQLHAQWHSVSPLGKPTNCWLSRRTQPAKTHSSEWPCVLARFCLLLCFCTVLSPTFIVPLYVQNLV